MLKKLSLIPILVFAFSNLALGKTVLPIEQTLCKVANYELPTLQERSQFSARSLNYFNLQPGDSAIVDLPSNIVNAKRMFQTYSEFYRDTIRFQEELDLWRTKYEKKTGAKWRANYPEAYARATNRLIRKYESQGLKLRPFFGRRTLPDFLKLEIGKSTLGPPTEAFGNRTEGFEDFAGHTMNDGRTFEVNQESDAWADKSEKRDRFTLLSVSQDHFRLRMTESGEATSGAFLDFDCLQ